jgi:hypothetical protein
MLHTVIMHLTQIADSIQPNGWICLFSLYFAIVQRQELSEGQCPTEASGRHGESLGLSSVPMSGGAESFLCFKAS